MRIIADSTMRRWARQYPDAAPLLMGWLQTVRGAAWANMAEVRRTYAHADAVKVASGNTITVFNIAGNKYRLITAIHYNRGVVHTLRFLTHAEYSKDRWKTEL